jgi:hypothetical protein
VRFFRNRKRSDKHRLPSDSRRFGIRWDFREETARAAQEVRVNSLRRRRKLAKLSRRTRWTLSAGMSLLLVAVFAPIAAASGQ